MVMQELKMMLRLSREAFFCVTFKKQEKTFPHTDASFGVINNPNTLEIILKAAILRPEIRKDFIGAGGVLPRSWVMRETTRCS